MQAPGILAMTNNEQKAVTSLAIIMACRMLGLFMILPVFSLYATHLKYATPTLIGLALGVYGLTQACLQIPFGSLSDRIGRKKVITIGLIIFAIGSIVAAMSHSIYGIIIGRAIQGAGAIGSTILALAADLTRDENRVKAMASIGLAIGLSFMVAMVAGPLLNHWVHLSGIFWAILVLSILSLVLVHTILPNPPKLIANPNTEYQSNQFLAVLKNKQLLRLDLGIFTMHAMLTATFIAIPILLTHTLKISQFDQVILYVIILPLAFMIMLPFIIVGEKKRKLKTFFIGSIVALILAEVALASFKLHFIVIAIAMLLFFTAFTLLEASLPSIVSKIAPIQRKGTAMGVYSTSQFLGIFIGGSIGGVIYTHFHLIGLFLFCALLGLFWLCFALSMKHPPYLSTLIFKVKDSVFHKFDELQQQLNTTQGVGEISAMPTEGLIYIKADKKIIDKEQLRKLIDACTLRQ